MEMQITRVNFFDGQFLRQAEFLDLERYHRHMRRRWGYVLFDQTGVLQITPDDLTVEAAPLVGEPKRVRIRAGMAIGKRSDILEAKEVILREEAFRNLEALGVGAGQVARITLHYDETPPSAEGTASIMRIDELAVITVHTSDPPAIAANGEPFIRLGDVDFDAMTVDASARQLARLNAALVSGGAAGPSLTGITLSAATTTINPGASVTLIATGAFDDGSASTLDPATLTWTSSDVGVATVNAAGVVTGVANGNADITAERGGIVSTPLAITVTPAAVVVTIDAVLDSIGSAGTSVRIRGTNLHDASISAPDPAAGTVVRLVDSANPANFALAPAVQVGAPIAGSPQRLDVTVPARTDFAVSPPTPLVTFINIEVQFGGGGDTAVNAFRYSA